MINILNIILTIRIQSSGITHYFYNLLLSHRLEALRRKVRMCVSIAKETMQPTLALCLEILSALLRTSKNSRIANAAPEPQG